MDKITRLLTLYSSLVSGNEINKTMFCFENECSPRSFDRDIEDIRLFLSEVYSTSELKYNRINHTYCIEGAKKQELEVTEYLFIEKILQNVSVLRNDEFSILKSHLLMNTRDTSKILISSNIKFRYKTPDHNKAILKIYGDLELAIRSLKYIRMVYRDDISEKNVSDMIPCSINYQDGHLYFMGYIEENKTINIKLEQIYSFQVLREQTIDERKKVDRYENNIADAIAQLDKMDVELPRKVSEIFDVPYAEKTEDDLKQEAERAERIKRLKEFTDETQYVDKIDKIAFDQDELYDLLDENVNEIYLFGDRFEIPLSVKGISYKGSVSSSVRVRASLSSFSIIGINCGTMESR